MNDNKLEKAVKELQEQMRNQKEILRNICLFTFLHCVVLAVIIGILYTGGLI